MKQILQDMTSGKTSIVDAPAPKVTAESVLVATSATLISAGTERMLVEFGKAGFLNKARQQPEKVKMVLEKIGTDGLSNTLDAVRSKLAQPLPLGYCNVGVVHKVGSKVSGCSVGDRIVSNGPHADVVKVSKNLTALIPDSVDDETAAFTVVSSIGLQGVRLAAPTIGESFVVVGTGLIGLLTVQILRANGCRVLAIDFDRDKLALAETFGAEVFNPLEGGDPVSAGLTFSRGQGVDGVIITASSKSNDPIKQSAQMCRKRGRIILVGVTGLELDRSDFYEKELSFQVSCSYGPGRYDTLYEDKGQDYPLPFVRWTEQRNFEAVLDMMASGKLNVKSLITHRYSFENASEAYQILTDDRSALGILLAYSSDYKARFIRKLRIGEPGYHKSDEAVVGVIGAGNYSSRVLIPAFKTAGAKLHSLCTAGGINSVIHGKKANFHTATSDADDIFRHDDINTVVIATRHDSHADLVARAISAGKHTFVEKPLSIDLRQLREVQSRHEEATKKSKAPQLMVGFNRRYAPHVQKMKELLNPIKAPKTFVMTMNAGDLPKEHWTQDNYVGVGRIIGEACHYIDLMRFLAGHEVVSVQGRRMGKSPGIFITEDKACITLGFADGSFGTIFYLANGAAAYPKERVEVFAGGGVLQLDNFRILRGYGWRGFKKMRLWKQDKGQEACAKAFLKSIESGIAAIPPAEIFEVARVSIEAAHLLREQT